MVAFFSRVIGMCFSCGCAFFSGVIGRWYPGSGVVFDCIACTLSHFDYQSCFVCAAWQP